MACSNCNTPNCGCSGTYVVSQTCPPACSEVFNSACIVYTGVDITCPDNTSGITSTVVSRNDYLDTALTKIINYFCGRFNSLVIPTTVVESDDPGIVVVEQILGSVTTYLLSLDPAALPSASIVTAGDNVVVTGDGSAGDPYVVNANESIVAVDAASALTLIVDPSTPGPYETTYTIGIDNDLLPTIDLSSLWGYISITPIPNTPNAGDTTFQLDVDQVTVDASDARLISTLTSPGQAPANFLRTFDITIDETEMENWIIESVIYSSLSNPKGLIAGTGISLNWNPATFQLEIENDFTDPLRWFELFDFAGNDVTPTSGSAILRILANPATVALGGDGISAILSGTGTDANFQLLNTDPGSAQSIFGSVEVSGQPTITADSNIEVLTVVAGVDIEVTTDNTSKALTITNGINAVYSNIEGDDSVSLQAGSTTDTLDILGGTGITTEGNAAGPGNNQLTINNDGILSVASADANLTVNTVAGACTITNAAPNVDQNLWLTINGDTGTTSANNDADTLTISGGLGIDNVTVAGDTVTINADVDRDDLEITVAAGITSPTQTHGLIGPTGVLETYVQVRVFAKSAPGGYTLGQDITSECTLIFPAAGDYTVQTTAYAGDIAVVILG